MFPMCNGKLVIFHYYPWPTKQSRLTNFKGLFSVYSRAQSIERWEDMEITFNAVQSVTQTEDWDASGKEKERMGFREKRKNGKRERDGNNRKARFEKE